MNFSFTSRAPLLMLMLMLAIGSLAPYASHAAPPEREATRLRISLVANADVNPDDKQRATPIEVFVFELKNPQTFEQADYFSIYHKDRSILGQDLIKKDAYLLRPGEHRLIERKSDQETVAIGVLAGYRELGISLWRAVYRLKAAPEVAWYRALIPSNKAELDIRLEARGISITELNK